MTDRELQDHVQKALDREPSLESADIGVSLSDGMVERLGHVQWEYRRTAALRAVRDLAGVCGVQGLITVDPHVTVADVQANIEVALKRSAEIDARRAAWAAPVVKSVEDHVAIVP